MPRYKSKEEPRRALQLVPLEIWWRDPISLGPYAKVLWVLFHMWLTLVSRGLVHPSTANRRIREESTASRASIGNAVDEDAYPRLHWIDNYAKSYAANSIFIEKEQFRSMLWTAHAMKKLPSNKDMSWIPKAPHIYFPALPSLRDLLRRVVIDNLFTELASFERLQFDASFVVIRHVTRIPLKPSPATPEEKLHLDNSCDGLRYLHPVDIYPDNVVSSDGLIAVLHRLQLLEGFGSSDHQRAGSYSLLHADVAIFWQALRLLYCYSGMAPLRQDLFLALGLWHPYLYAHVAIWNEFRHTFLAPAFFLLFPNQTLMRRPRLSHSSTFFTWLRLAYPQIRALLSASLYDIQMKMMTFELDRTRAIRLGQVTEKINLYRARYIHILNLQTLFEFCLPAIQDYGSLLKSNDFFF